jgi:hypothetical protein
MGMALSDSHQSLNAMQITDPPSRQRGQASQPRIGQLSTKEKKMKNVVMDSERETDT